MQDSRSHVSRMTPSRNQSPGNGCVHLCTDEPIGCHNGRECDGVKGSGEPASSCSVSLSDARPISVAYQRAVSHHRAGDLSLAASVYREILAKVPNHAGAIHFLGMVFFANREYQEALRLVEQSLRLCDQKAVYFNNYGAILNACGRLQDARNAFERAVILRSDYLDAWVNLAMVQQRLHESDDQVKSSWMQVLRLRPDHKEALSQLVRMNIHDHLYPDAMRLWKRQVQGEKSTAQDSHQFATLCGECGLITEAKDYFRKSAALKDGKKVWRWKHLWYSPSVFDTEEEIAAYWDELNNDLDCALAEQSIFDWKSLFSEGFTHSFNLPHHHRCCRGELEKYAKLFTSSFPFDKPNDRPGQKIRVGFLVTPGHENGFIRMTSGVMAQLDRDRFEVVLIHHVSSTSRLKAVPELSETTQISYTWDPEASVRKIRELRCDVIYYWKVAADLWSFFLPMCHLAPIQCTSWGTHGTSGMPQIDWYLSWARAEISAADAHYTEHLYRINTTPLYEQVPLDIPPPASRRELGLPEAGTIYFCPHRIQKYHPLWDHYIREILERDRAGHVVMLTGHVPYLREKLSARLRRNVGEELFGRIIQLPSQTVSQYYRYLSASTLILHSPVYTGEITTVDGFLYGVPGVTQTGELLIQRYTTGVYDEAGIQGPAVRGQSEYVNQAVEIGTDHGYRERLSREISAYRKSFFENRKTVREWERFLIDVVSQERR